MDYSVHKFMTRLLEVEWGEHASREVGKSSVPSVLVAQLTDFGGLP